MQLLDAKIILTQYGNETYVNKENTVEIKELQTPKEHSPFYRILIGIEYLLLKEGKYYDSQKNYFWLVMDEDFRSLVIEETETENIFALKSEEERQATQELIGKWLIHTDVFKNEVQNNIDKMKNENVVTVDDIYHAMKSIKFLEKLLELKTEDILSASVKI
jgi:hypothetical protein